MDKFKVVEGDMTVNLQTKQEIPYDASIERVHF